MHTDDISGSIYVVSGPKGRLGPTHIEPYSGEINTDYLQLELESHFERGRWAYLEVDAEAPFALRVTPAQVEALFA